MMLFLGAQTFIPFPNLRTRFWNSLSRTQDLLFHERVHQPLEVLSGIRMLFFSPHPDDEVLAAGGIIQRVIEDEGNVGIIFITNGDGYVEGVRRFFGDQKTTTREFVLYGIKRHNEAVRAISSLGLSADDGRFLGFPDQGIDSLWKQYWSRLRPYTSPYTHFSEADYKSSYDRWAKYSGVDLDLEIQRIIKNFKPDWIVISDPRDYHPDHSATGVFVIDALRRMHENGELAVGETQVFSYLVHYPDYPTSNRWMEQLAKNRFSGSEEISDILANAAWTNFSLTTDELAKKQLSLSEYKTQLQVLGSFMKQFIRPYEIFGRLDIS